MFRCQCRLVRLSLVCTVCLGAMESNSCRARVLFTRHTFKSRCNSIRSEVRYLLSGYGVLLFLLFVFMQRKYALKGCLSACIIARSDLNAECICYISYEAQKLSKLQIFKVWCNSKRVKIFNCYFGVLSDVAFSLLAPSLLAAAVLMIALKGFPKLKEESLHSLYQAFSDARIDVVGFLLPVPSNWSVFLIYFAIFLLCFSADGLAWGGATGQQRSAGSEISRNHWQPSRVVFQLSHTGKTTSGKAGDPHWREGHSHAVITTPSYSAASKYRTETVAKMRWAYINLLPSSFNIYLNQTCPIAFYLLCVKAM